MKKILVAVSMLILLILVSCTDDLNEPKTPINPTCQIKTPANNASVVRGSAVTVTAEAADEDGKIEKVLFYLSETLLGSDATAEQNNRFSCSFTVSADTGVYSLRAEAYDNDGLRSTHAIDVRVISPQAVIVVNQTTLNFNSVLIGSTSGVDSFTVSGSNLSQPLSISAPECFEISQTAGSAWGNAINLQISKKSKGSVSATVIFVRFKPAAALLYSREISCSSTGAVTQKVVVVGNGTTPTTPEIIAVDSLGGFGQVTVNTESEAKSFTVIGKNLSQNIIVTAPTGFIISNGKSNKGVSGSKSVSLPPTGGVISVKFAPSMVGEYLANIVMQSNGAGDKMVKVRGTGINLPTYTISGQITDSKKRSGATGVTLAGLPGNVQTDANGNYSAQVAHGWSGTVTPTKAGYTFIPANRQYNNVITNQTAQNYTAAVVNYTISGQITDSQKRSGVAGVTLTGLPGNVQTDASGNYTAQVIHGWSGTVTPTKAGYTFTPATRQYNNVITNQTVQNYTAAVVNYTISGQITDSQKRAGVTLAGLPGNVQTDASGNYTAQVIHGWSGTVTPTKAGYTFTPATRQYNNVITNQTVQNYAGNNQLLTDLLDVPAGAFNMGAGTGSSGETPIHNVTLTDSYKMGKYEITNQQYCSMLNYAKEFNLIAVSDSIISNTSGVLKGLKIYGNGKGILLENGVFVPETGMANRPVLHVSWYGAAFYCNVLSRFYGNTELYDLTTWICDNYGNTGYRMATEAEWEYVARYNDGRIYPWGNEEPNSELANYGSTQTTNVGSYPLGVSKLGFLDIAGNVFEWCNDWKNTYTASNQTNPEGLSNGTHKILRGGSWNYAGDVYCKTTYRGSTKPEIYLNYAGFRIVKTGQ